MSRKARKRLAVVTLLDLAAGAVVVAAASAPGHAQTPVSSWTGFYYGAHVGARAADTDYRANGYRTITPGSTFDLPAISNNLTPDGGIGGFHTGYNWQFNPAWLFGVESDWTWGRSKEFISSAGSGLDTAGDAFTFRRNSELTLTWQATIRARSGFVVDRSLWYVTGGVAFQQVRWFDTITVQTNAPAQTLANFSFADKVLTGWVGGVGYEQLLTQNFTWRVEYLYESFSDFNVPQGLGTRLGTVDTLNVHKVRVGFTFKTP